MRIAVSTLVPTAVRPAVHWWSLRRPEAPVLRLGAWTAWCTVVFAWDTIILQRDLGMRKLWSSFEIEIK